MKEGHIIIGPGCQSIPFDGLLMYYFLLFFAVFGRVFLGLVRQRGAGRVVIGVPGRSVFELCLRFCFACRGCTVGVRVCYLLPVRTERGIKGRG